MTAKNTSQAGKAVGELSAQQTSLPLRILVVDDDGVTRQLNTEVLSQFGYHVDAAEDVAVAWNTLELNKYDLLIADNDMPTVSGFELLRKLRSARKSLPVIMATEALPKKELSQFPLLQPAAILQKPYTLVQLVKTVQQVLSTTESVGGQTGSNPDVQSGS
jgi:CheY-like chemotaxis protein